MFHCDSMGIIFGDRSEHTDGAHRIDSQDRLGGAHNQALLVWRLSSKCREVRDQDVAKWDITCQGWDCLSLRIEGYACSQNFILMASTLQSHSWPLPVSVISDILRALYHMRQQTWPCLTSGTTEVSHYCSIMELETERQICAGLRYSTRL